MMAYVKPAIKVVNVNNVEKVAGNCWSDSSSQGKTFYWNDDHPGYLEIVTPQNCKHGQTCTITFVATPRSIAEHYDGKQCIKELQTLWDKYVEDYKQNWSSSEAGFEPTPEGMS